MVRSKQNAIRHYHALTSDNRRRGKPYVNPALKRSGCRLRDFSARASLALKASSLWSSAKDIWLERNSRAPCGPPRLTTELYP